MRLHARIAEGVETLWADSLEAHASELAHHFAQAEALLGTEKLVRYSVVAGERALASHAYEEALIQFSRALAAKEGRPVDGETADILFGLGRAQAATLESVQMIETLNTMRLAFDYYADAHDVGQAIAVAEYHYWGTPGL